MKYAEVKIFSICVDIYRIQESDNFDKIYEVLSTLKNRKIKITNILIKKYKNMLENPDFEQDQWSGTPTGIYKSGRVSIRLMKWICFYDQS